MSVDSVTVDTVSCVRFVSVDHVFCVWLYSSDCLCLWEMDGSLKRYEGSSNQRRNHNCDRGKSYFFDLLN